VFFYNHLSGGKNMYRTITIHIVAALVLLLLTLPPRATLAQPGTVLDSQKISDT
jgi:hypothetical protein